jgi:hypothetical protein
MSQTKDINNNKIFDIGANIKNTFFECATMWNEAELDNIVFSLPTTPQKIIIR